MSLNFNDIGYSGLFVDKIIIRKIAITCLLIAGVLISYAGWLDDIAEEYTEQGIQRTLITYAVSRSLNGVISVAQGTEIAVSPAGVGLTFAPGQILDPVNDLIERFSWVVMVSGASLGIQRLFLEMTSSSMVNALMALLVIVFLSAYWFAKQTSADRPVWQNLLSKSIILIIFIRFSVPLIAVLNEGLYLAYLQPRYDEAQSQLENASEQINTINSSSREKAEQQTDDGLLSQVEQWLEQTKQSLDVEAQMNSLKQAAADVSQQVINMIVVFVVQTIIFPLIFLWLFIRAAKLLMARILI